MLMATNARLPPHLNQWSGLPAYLEDAHLRRFPIHLDTINSWAIFDFILEEKFSDIPGYLKVKNGSYMLEDSITRTKLGRTSEFETCFRPGRTILMSMLFYHMQHEQSSCPGCHAVNQDSGRSDVRCSFCGMQYRRITDVIEDNEEKPSIHANSVERSKKNLNGRLFSGPRTPAEANHADEDVTEFKRVQIVAPSQPSEGMQDLSLESLAKIPGEFPSGKVSLTVAEKIAQWRVDELITASAPTDSGYASPRQYPSLESLARIPSEFPSGKVSLTVAEKIAQWQVDVSIPAAVGSITSAAPPTVDMPPPLKTTEG
ncbi:hypothetical protein K469DRAFT_295057 [Zopfia rhizophila CBS 207.26]|uniref:Ubiquitin-like domain-containing protein n=1 Tax=Zopfia rhizophila CBS 207.26 TaxID=1314779 RepID=A0A6A6DK89_9PEZI|nr:hypothetical protein K469DRAFT_295057 [Zopfia rhizophila CBS 207.26]